MNRLIHILLIRHGQTEANAQGRLQGHLPTPLNRAGVRQANLVAARLAGHAPPLEVIISSDLPRATETAAPIASACGLQLKVDPAWRERSFGLLEGKPVGDKTLWEAASGESDIPGAEPAGDMRQRVFDALNAIPSTYSNKHVIAVVTHGGPIRSILRMLVDGTLPLTSGHPSVEMCAIPNCAILHMTVRGEADGFHWKVDTVNDVSHLKDDF